MIIYATGFDAITGSFDRIDIRGADGRRLKDKWKGGPQTFLGIQVEGFPNMLMLVGPHTALGNIPRSIEYNVDWVTRLIAHMRRHLCTRADARPEAVSAWTDFVHEEGQGPALQRGRQLDDGHQPERRGQERAHHRPLQRQRAGLSQACRRGGRERLLASCSSNRVWTLHAFRNRAFPEAEVRRGYPGPLHLRERPRLSALSRCGRGRTGRQLQKDFRYPPVTLMWRATAGCFVRRSMTKSWPLGLREIASRWPPSSSSSPALKRAAARAGRRRRPGRGTCRACRCRSGARGCSFRRSCASSA